MLQSICKRMHFEGLYSQSEVLDKMSLVAKRMGKAECLDIYNEVIGAIMEEARTATDPAEVDRVPNTHAEAKACRRLAHSLIREEMKPKSKYSQEKVLNELVLAAPNLGMETCVEIYAETISKTTGYHARARVPPKNPHGKLQELTCR